MMEITTGKLEIAQLGIVGAAIWAYFVIWFGVALVQSRNDVADIAWGPGFLVGALACLFQRQGVSAAGVFALAMTTLWAFRLSFYIARRNRLKSEDFRYRKWREEWGRWVVLRSFLQVFTLQALFLWVIGSPLWAVLLMGSLESFDPLFLGIGIGVWTLGFFFEAVGDFQMGQFKKKKPAPDTVMNQGLWKYTRHPNYFGESVMGWGLFLICWSGGVPVWTALGPAVLTYLLVRVSGVPMLEAKYKKNPAYQQYQNNTPAFIPGFPKRTSG